MVSLIKVKMHTGAAHGYRHRTTPVLELLSGGTVGGRWWFRMLHVH